MACPRCGQENALDARFCSSCGTNLEAVGTIREERKIVSVLFIDLVGFTSRSDQADPEDVRDVLQRYHSSVKRQIERFGGTVEKFIGDAVMAVFGAPFAHTDDPERAVRAGLRALETVEELNRRQPELGLAARAAVNTGEAVVAIGTGHERGEALALGDVVNTASRLQTSAPSGRLVVGYETHRATRDAIEYEELAPVHAKGKTEPLVLWLAVEPLAAPAERRMRSTSMIGRERELSLLGSIWEAATNERRPHLVTVIGPPGIGKSRLSKEFSHVVEQTGGRTISGRCLPYDTNDVYGAFAQQVRDVADILDQDPSAKARVKLDKALSGIVDPSEHQEVLRSLSLLLGLGLDAPVDEQLLLLFSARRLIECLGDKQPTLFVFDDVHWADSGQLDLIEYVATHVRDTPIVSLALARPELYDIRPQWGSGLHAQSTISLNPVSDAAAAAIVTRLVDEQLPSQDLKRLIGVAEGNPLFLEELTTAVKEGVDLGEELPTTVRAAIAGRVDALPRQHRGALLAASVVGKAFWPGALKALGQTEGIEIILDELEMKDLVRRESSTRIQGEVEFSFKHILIRDVCYSTLPRAERRRAHAVVAGYIEGVTVDKGRELAWLLAHHWEEAGDSEKAIDYLLLAADRAQEAMAESDTMSLFERAIALAPDEASKQRVLLLRGLARARFEDFDEAFVELKALLPVLEGRDLMEALLALARSSHWTERTDEALEVSQRALDTAEQLGFGEFVAPAMARLSQAHAMRGKEGDLDRALELGEKALDAWTPGLRSNDLAEHEHLLADQHYWTGSYKRSLDLAGAAREKAVDPGSLESRLRGTGMEGLLFAAMGRYEEAFSRFDSVIALGRELGRPLSVLLNYSTLAFREVYDLDGSRLRSQESLDLLGQPGSFHMPWMNAEVDLIHSDVLAGEMGRAETRWSGLWDDVRSTTAWERWLLGGKMAALRAEIALATEGPEEAAEWAGRAVDMARRVRRAKYEAAARTSLGKALLALGEHEKATEELRTAVAGADGLINPYGRWRARAELATALQASGDDAGAQTQLREASAIITTVAEGLSQDRSQKFLAAEPVAEILRSL